jgi:hypothetical protein
MLCNIALLCGNALFRRNTRIPALRKEAGQYSIALFTRQCTFKPRAWYLHSLKKLATLHFLRGNALLSHVHGIPAFRKEAGQHLAWDIQQKVKHILPLHLDTKTYFQKKRYIPFLKNVIQSRSIQKN